MFIHPVYIQAFYYGLLMIIVFFIVSMLFKGFFLKYVKVRLSFGKYVLVKIRSPIRDYFAVGWVEESFLCFKRKVDGTKAIIRAIVPKETPFYRCLSVLWVDYDEETADICKCDYTGAKSFDPVKYDNLLVRALQKPAIGDNMQKIMIVLLVIAIAVGIAGVYFGYINTKGIEGLNNIPGMISNLKGTISATNSLA